jgi:hypothetical protein
MRANMKKTAFKGKQKADIGISSIDDLWQRVGNKLKSKDVKRKDIASLIRKARTARKTTLK